MHLITINANGQILSMCQCDQLVSDSIDVLEVQFVFDNAWAGMVKTAQFTQKNKETQAFDTYNVLIDDVGIAYVPNEITNGVCIISVFGVLGGKRMTTAPLAVSVLKSGFIADGSTPIPPTPDLYQQLLEEFWASSYELPTASADTLGGVKVGSGLGVAADGTLWAVGGGEADSVKWENVTDKPEIFNPAEHKHQASDIEGLSDVATSGDYSDLKNLPGTFPPAEHTHTPEQAGALPAQGTAADAAKLGGKLPGCYHRPYNLLVNSNFTNPVNQQGLTTYSGLKYMIDGWKGSPCEVAVNEGSISVGKGAQAYGILAQFTPQLTAGKTYTLAAKNTAGEIATLTFVPEVSMSHKQSSFATAEHTIIARYSTASKEFYVGVATTSDTPMAIVWIALYEGTYTKANLPEYFPKGYTTEYLDCLREYYYIPSGGVPGIGVVSAVNTIALIAVTLPAPMRITPTAKLLVAGEVRAGGVTRAVQSIAVHNQRGNVVLLDVTVATELPAAQPAALVTTSFELDARL